MGLLIVNADDYGLTEGISRGILLAHLHGVVTSTSVLGNGRALSTAGSWLTAVDMAVGVHLAAVGEDPPLLSAREVPSLVDRRGRLPRTWRAFLLRSAAGRVDMEDLAKEFEAQLGAATSLGVPLTHVDTHQHLHLWPPVAKVVIDLARRAGIAGIRVPRSHRLGAVRYGVNRLAARLAAQCRAAGLRFPAFCAGVDQAGRLDGPAFDSALETLARMGAPTAELCAHPGVADDPPRSRYRWGYHWQDELSALTDPALPAKIAAHDFVLGTYADLPP
jgi:predicted glycoside hydrolase/deacetylase ChbG (UPF0249 family)